MRTHLRRHFGARRTFGTRTGLFALALLSTAAVCSSAQAGFLPARMAYIDAHAHALYTVVPSHPQSTQLIYGTGFPHSPVWSPNGETLAFFASDGGLASPWLKIVLANRAGHVIGDLLQGTHSQISWLDWSPDGKRIAYSCGNGQSPQDWEVCIIDVKTHAHHGAPPLEAKMT